MLFADQPDRAEITEKAAAGRGLDWLNLFVANVQTGFGPFISVYLTTEGWTQTGIGVALSVGTIAAMASQIPAGALVDAIRSKARVAFFSIVAFTASALMFTIAPIPLFIYLGQILHSFSSCTLGPAIATISRRIAGEGDLGVRLGRNARYASVGNAMGAALMGAVGYYVSEQSVFFMTAALTLPALVALVPIERYERRALPAIVAARRSEPLGRVLGDRRLLVFALCAALFTFANAALLPLASVGITKVSGDTASLIIAAAIVLPQLTVAVISPSIGRLAERLGRRPVLILGFCIVPLRAALLAATADPLLILPIQILDGIAAACFGVMVPLVTSDVAGRTGHFNVSLGLVGFAVGIGATLSTAVGGWLADQHGEPVAFLGLAAVGVVAAGLVRLAMVETRPQRKPPHDQDQDSAT
jgi:MFS family permease